MDPVSNDSPADPRSSLERSDEGPPASEPAGAPGGPGVEKGEQPWRRLDRGSVGAARTASLIAWGVLGGLGVLFLGGGSRLERANEIELDADDLRRLWIVAGALWLAFVARAWIWPRLVFARTRYRLSGAALEIRRGVLFHSWNAVPRSRVQHTDVACGPIQRRFGVATLLVHTAGTSNATIGLSGVSQRTAEALRDELMRGLQARDEDGV